MKERYMPVLLSSHYKTIFKNRIREVPFGLLSEEYAQRNHSQTLGTLAYRGGLSPGEMMANILKVELWTYFSEKRDIRRCYDDLDRHIKEVAENATTTQLKTEGLKNDT